MIKAKDITVCAHDKCAGCMACVDLCPKQAITIVDSHIAYNAVIDENKWIHCNLCEKICQNNKKVNLLQPISWNQGWIKDEEVRGRSSSGGAAKALSLQFIKDGGVVISCCFQNGVFHFECAKTAIDLEKFVGSKYVKSNPSGVYKNIIRLIKDNQKVLFIGLPCQVSAVKSVVGNSDYLYTVDLICHGTPSPELLKDYLYSHSIELDKIGSISFRNKSKFGLRQNERYISYPGSCDAYSLAFLCGIDYTENCYNCCYAGTKRISDITIGDSWGSDLPIDEQKKGISLILCQTEKGKNLLNKSNMELFPVSAEKAISANHQLREPTPKTKKHDKFFAVYTQGGFDKATLSCMPDKYIKQRIKAFLLKAKILRGGVNYNITYIK